MRRRCMHMNTNSALFDLSNDVAGTNDVTGTTDVTGTNDVEGNLLLHASPPSPRH